MAHPPEPQEGNTALLLGSQEEMQRLLSHFPLDRDSQSPTENGSPHLRANILPNLHCPENQHVNSQMARSPQSLGCRPWAYPQLPPSLTGALILKVLPEAILLVPSSSDVLCPRSGEGKRKPTLSSTGQSFTSLLEFPGKTILYSFLLGNFPMQSFLKIKV